MSDLLTIAQVAELLGISEDTVTRRLAKLPGVIDLGSPETPKRRYRVLRIPRSVVEKYVAARGGRLTIPAPTKPSKPTRKAPTETELTHDLARLAGQHGAAAKKLLEKIASRARMLTHVPPDEWADLMWCDEDDEEETRR